MRDNSEKSVRGLFISSKAGQGNNPTELFSLATGYWIQINSQIMRIQAG